MQSEPTVRGPHRERPISFLGPHDTGGWRPKVYGLRHVLARPDGPDVGAHRADRFEGRV
ncbi:hypothetical protein Acsp04_30610 [Actinomadura sp. NBRC 104425]|uniref:hypothetical protein n=1 Tax=Actinomadura sp. NBRC 104425 TaxID=3032204 RepID=UPI0024A5DA8C|nr:hypothetical protein [Actinomadura sp. NBRC 104425]GLZ12826.1 hypothetical protein Acsp04_30610 [Actinomadura sp. NBRC 104425]